jgi:hypothetical protein
MGYPKHYVVFDTETVTSYGDIDNPVMTLTLKMGVAKYVDMRVNPPRESYLYFEDAMSFHEHITTLTDPKEHMWLFAHNAGFDIRIIKFFDYLTKGWYSLWSPSQLVKGPPLREPFVVLENPPMMIQCWSKKGGSMMWCDTYQWIAHKLATVGEILGLAKLPMPSPDAPDIEWYAYCKRDVDVLDMALRRIWDWLKGDGCDRFMPTRAGQSRYIYKKQYEHKSIVYHDNEQASRLERHAYYGGRTDLWYVGEVNNKTYQLDVNSLYPYVMREKWFPCELTHHYPGPATDRVPPAKDHRHLTAEVWIDDPEHSYPPRCREGTLFVRGRVHTVMSGPELEIAVGRGAVKRVGQVNVYRMQQLFKKYIDYYWMKRCEAKENNDKVQDMIVKLFMNSLYGKFGQLTSDWVYHDSGMPPDTYGIFVGPGGGGEQPRKSRVLGGHVFQEVERHEAKGSFIAIASFTTAYARQHMETLKCRLVGGRYYYQATDSLYVDQVGFDEFTALGLIDPKKLGSLKDEGSYDTMMFRNIHHINKGDKEVRGSVRENSPRVGNDTFVVDIWESFKRAVFDGHTDRVLIRKILKHMPGKYIRQEVLDDGTTRPWKVDNWDVPLADMAKIPLSHIRTITV